MTVAVSPHGQRVAVSGGGSVSVGRPGSIASAASTPSVAVETQRNGVAVSPSTPAISVASGTTRQRQAVFDIRDFGAVGDGVTDCTAAFEAAFSAAGSDYYLGGGFEYPGTTGAQVLVPSGVFRHSDLVVPNNVTLTGLGRTVSAMRALPGTSVGITLSRFATLRDMYVRGGSVADDIVRVNGARTLVRDVHINGDGSSARGVAVLDPSGLSPFYAPQFCNLIVEGVDGTAVFVGVSDSQWLNIWVASGDGTGVHISGTNTEMTNLHVWERGLYGVLLGPTAISNRLVNAYIETNFRAGVICFGYENTISTGRIWKNGDGGVLVKSDAAGQTPMRNRFIGLEFRENKATASILFDGGYQNVVSGCVFSDPFFDATWAVEERNSAFTNADYNVVDVSNVVVLADFSAGAVSLVGANSVDNATVVTP